MATIGLAPFEMGEHRVGVEGDGAAEGLDGHAGLPAGQGRLAGRDQPAVFGVPRRGGVGHGGGRPGGQDHQSGGNPAFHAAGNGSANGPVRPSDGTFRRRRCLTPQRTGFRGRQSRCQLDLL